MKTVHNQKQAKPEQKGVRFWAYYFCLRVDSILLAVLFLLCVEVVAQGVVTNVTVEAGSGAELGQVEVSYDLGGVVGMRYAVSLAVSLDGGESYQERNGEREWTVSGDGIGLGLAPGEGLTFVWDAGADLRPVDNPRIRLRVVARVVNAPPVVVAIEDQVIDEGVLWTYQVEATDEDEPLVSLVYTLIEGPEGMELDEATGLLEWTPSENQGPDPEVNVRLSVSDGLGASLISFTVQVEEVNSAPRLAPAGPFIVNAGDTFSLDLEGSESDIPEQALTYRLVSGPAGANVSSAGRLSWTPGEGTETGPYELVVEVSDGALSASQRIQVVVSSAPSGAEDFIVYAGSANESSAMEMIWVPAGIFQRGSVEGGDADEAAHTVNLTHGYWLGAYEVTQGQWEGLMGTNPSDFPELGEAGPVTNVSWSDALSFCEALTEQEREAGRLPEGYSYGLPTEAQWEYACRAGSGTLFSFGDESDVSALGNYAWYIENAGGSPQTVGEKEPNAWGFYDMHGNVYEWCSDWYGDYPRLGVSDPMGVYAGSFRVLRGGSWALTATHLRSANRQRAPAAQLMGEYGFRVALKHDAGVFHENGELFAVNEETLWSESVAMEVAPLADWDYELSQGPEGIEWTDSTATLTWTPGEADGPQEYDIRVRAKQGAETIESLIGLTVREVNKAPRLLAQEDLVVDEGVEVSFTAQGVDDDIKDEPTTLTYSLVTGPENASLSSLGGVFTWTPTEAQGPDEGVIIEYSVSDGELSASQQMSIRVNEVNEAPGFVAKGPFSVNELEELTFTLEGTDSDLPANTLRFSLTEEVSGVSVDAVSGVVSWTPSEDQGDTSYDLNFGIFDGTATTVQTVQVRVNEVNRGPSLAELAPLVVNEREEMTFTAVGSDEDLPADDLSYALIDAPEGATIDSVSGVFTWTPTEAQGLDTQYDFEVEVSDGKLSARRAVSIKVNEVNQAPTLAALGPFTINELEPFNYSVSGSDGDIPVQTLSYSLSGNVPEGLSLNGSSGAMTWTPSEVQGPGEYDFEVRVSDGSLSASRPVAFKVNEVNEAPELVSQGPFQVDELEQLAFNIQASDEGGLSTDLTYELLNRPEGATLNPTTGAFAWTPNEEQGPGSYNLQIRVSDTELTALQTINVTVREVNTAPRLLAQEDLVVDEGVEVSFTAQGVDDDIKDEPTTLTYSLVSGPANASLSSSSGVFRWTPTEQQGPAEAVVIEFAVTDDGELSASQQMSIRVNEVNEAPGFVAKGPFTVNEQEELTFILEGTDIDFPANTLSYSLAEEVVGVSVDEVSGAVRWTPGEDQDGLDQDLKFAIADGNATTIQTVRVSVNEVNRSPALQDPGVVSFLESELFAFDIQGSDPDVPANTLTFDLVNGPEGASLDPQTGRFTWTPTEEQGPGEYEVEIGLSDERLRDAFSWTLQVQENNIPPSTLVGRQLAFMELDLGGQLSEEEAIQMIWVEPGTYLRGSPLTESGRPAFQGENDPERLHEVTISRGFWMSQYEVTQAQWEAVMGSNPAQFKNLGVMGPVEKVSWTDATQFCEQLTIQEQTAGRLPSGYIFSLPTEAQWEYAARAGRQTRFFYGEDESMAGLGDYGLNGNNAGGSPRAVGRKAPNPWGFYDFYGNVREWCLDWYGDYPLNSVTDPLGPNSGTYRILRGGSWLEGPDWNRSAARDRQFAYVSSNDAGLRVCLIPISGSAQTPNAIAGFNYQMDEQESIYLTFAGEDPDIPEQPLTFGLEETIEGMALDPLTGLLIWRPTEAQGPVEFKQLIAVSDGTDSLSQELTIDVREVNEAPVGVPAGDFLISELEEFRFTFEASDVDLPAQELTFSLEGAPAGAVINPATGVFSWNPPENASTEPYSFELLIHDGDVTTRQSVQITVTEQNAAPVLVAIAPQTIPEREEFRYTFEASDVDVPIQDLTFSLVGAPAGATVNPESGAFSWNPTEAQGPADYEFTVRVSDSVTTTDAVMQITVQEVNEAPTLVSFIPFEVNELELFTFTASGFDEDIPKQELVYSLEGAPEGASINPQSGVFQWTPPEDAFHDNSYNFQVRVKDEKELSEVITVTVDVLEVNVAPTLASIESMTINEMEPFSFTVTGQDVDLPANTLSYRLIGAPEGAQIDSAAGVFAWTPTEAQGGLENPYNFEVEVSDGKLAARQPVQIKVEEVNRAPILAEVSSMTVNELELLEFTLMGSDVDFPAPTLTYSLAGTVPEGVSVDSVSGLVSWTPTEAQGDGSEYQFLARVSDDEEVVERSVSIIVEEINQAPVIAVSEDYYLVKELEELRVELEFTDLDLPAQDLVVELAQGPEGAVLDNSTGVLTWTPQEGDGRQRFDFEISVSDGTGGPVTKVLNAEVLKENDFVLDYGGVLDPEEAIVLLWVEPGTFMMGSPEDELKRSPIETQHEVTLTEGFWMGSTEVTQKQWEVLMGSNPSSFTEVGGQAPVEQVSWEDVMVYCSLLNEQERLSGNLPVGYEYSLPTESQWEYTCRSGTDTVFHYGNTLSSFQANIAGTSPYGGAEVGPYLRQTTKVMSYKPNAWGFYDMHGNVWEWCADKYGSYSTEPIVNPIGPTSGSDRIARGGSWNGGAEHCRAANRSQDGQSNSFYGRGFRLSLRSQLKLLKIGNLKTREQELLTFQLQAFGTKTPSLDLVYSMNNAPAGTEMNTETGEFSWTPNEEQGPGTYTFNVSVTGGDVVATEEVTITVNEVNQPPVINQTFARVKELEALQISGIFADPDVPANNLVYELVDGPQGAVLDSDTGVLNWTPQSWDGKNNTLLPLELEKPKTALSK